MRKVLRNNFGFTLLELVIAIAVVAVVLLAATQGTIWMAKNNQDLALKTGQAASATAGSRGFASAFETASIAVSYEHMPVPNGGTGGCKWDSNNPGTFNGAGPCTAQLIGTDIKANDALPPASRLSGLLAAAVPYLEFFRDDNAMIVGAPGDPNSVHPFPWPGNGAIVQKTFPLTGNQMALASSSPYYVAWPLVPKSTLPAIAGPVATYPLLVMQASSATDPLLFSNITFQPSAGTGTVGRQALMQVTNFNDQPQVGTIYVIYDTYDPTQYVFQYAASVTDCMSAGGSAICQAIVDGNISDAQWDPVSFPNQNTWLPTNGPSYTCGGLQYLCPNTCGGVPCPGAGPVSPSPALWFQKATAPGTPQTYTGDFIHYFAIDLEPIPNNATLAGLYPTAASLFAGTVGLEWFDSKGTQGGQNVLAFPFPFLTEFDSLYETSPAPRNSAFQEFNAGGIVTAGAGEDIRKVAHYYQAILGSGSSSSLNSIGTTAQLVAVPVTLKSFNLWGPITSSMCTIAGRASKIKCDTFNLVMNTLSQVGPTAAKTKVMQTILMDHLPLDGATPTGTTPTAQGAVIIARQLGGENFQMFYYTPTGITVSSF